MTRDRRIKTMRRSLQTSGNKEGIPGRQPTNSAKQKGKEPKREKSSPESLRKEHGARPRDAETKGKGGGNKGARFGSVLNAR